MLWVGASYIQSFSNGYEQCFSFYVKPFGKNATFLAQFNLGEKIPNDFTGLLTKQI